MNTMINYVREQKEIMWAKERRTLCRPTKVEYASHGCSINHVVGCSHNCKYCFAKNDSKFYGTISSDEEWGQPKLVPNCLELLAREIPKLKPGTTVHLSFMTDPFMFGQNHVIDLSLRILTMLNAANIKCTVLTKGILPVEALATLSYKNEYGITVTSMDQNYCDYMEPGAAPVYARIASLRALHDRGFYTWVSIEPFPFPGMGPDTLDEILNAVSFVDKIIFGRVSKFKGSTQHMDFYLAKSQQVVNFCRSRGIDFHIKNHTPHEMCLLAE